MNGGNYLRGPQLGTEVFLGSTPPTEQGRPRQCGMFGAEVRASGADSESADLSQVSLLHGSSLIRSKG